MSRRTWRQIRAVIIRAAIPARIGIRAQPAAATLRAAFSATYVVFLLAAPVWCAAENRSPPRRLCREASTVGFPGGHQLPGCLATTRTGLSPASPPQPAGHTSPCGLPWGTCRPLAPREGGAAALLELLRASAGARCIPADLGRTSRRTGSRRAV